MVEHLLAKEKVASSSLVFRSRRRGQVVKAGVCKTPIGGSNPPVASTILLLSLAANLSAGLKGAYALLLHLPYAVELEVGRLGAVAFSSGYYVYLGSALGGLEARLCHHLRPAPKPRWHIDYLRRFAHPVEVWLCPTSSNLECLLYQTALGLGGAHRVVKGFGASDCRCWSHLVYFPGMPSFRRFERVVGKRGLRVERLGIETDT